MTDLCESADLLLIEEPFYGPMANEEQMAFLQRYARAQRIVSCIRNLNSISRTMYSNLSIVLDMPLLKEPRDFLLDELAATGHPLLLDIQPQPKNESIGNRSLKL
jgi:hypothetical protein